MTPSIKRGKQERSGARKRGRGPGDPYDQSLTPGGATAIPAAAIPSSPVSPGAAADLAAGGHKIVRGNSDQEPMTPEGHAQIQQVGEDLAAQGGPSRIAPGMAVRQQQTAQDLKATNPEAQMMPPDPRMDSHAMGNLEGQPKTPDVKQLIADLVRKAPNFRIPGQGAMSGKSGESWNEFRMRGLSAAQGLMQSLAMNPRETVVVPTSTQIVKLIEAWTANGTPDDLSVSPETYLHETSGAPGAMYKWAPGEDYKWQFQQFDPQSQPLAPGAIYFLLHGATASSTNKDALPTQVARAGIVKTVLGRDWKSAQTAVQQGLRQGLSPQDASDAIDEALPSPEDAENLSSPDLLAALSAASPAKQQQLLPAWLSRDQSGLPPDAAQQIRSHEGRIGIRRPQTPAGR